MGQLVRLKELYESTNKSIEIFESMKRDPNLLLGEYYSEKESWDLAVSLKEALFSGWFYFIHSITVE